MNNELNKQVELTEKELKDVVGGACVTEEILAEMKELVPKRETEKMVQVHDSLRGCP